MAEAVKTKEKKRPKLMAVIVEEGCTGCEVCIDFCPVPDCIVTIPGPDTANPGFNQTVRVVDDLCIGCRLCEKNCPWETIDMVPIEDYDREYVKYTGLGTPANYTA
ncbi:MAG: 4Fe-4S dicluster domain-containing protein [candidate division Zixibacteria bacterium]|nr:4Fe-4S dicluster domain-containing protein [candidate division Zixibacteria bacterium]